jgi:hypothetical protein
VDALPRDTELLANLPIAQARGTELCNEKTAFVVWWSSAWHELLLFSGQLGMASTVLPPGIQLLYTEDTNQLGQS